MRSISVGRQKEKPRKTASCFQKKDRDSKGPSSIHTGDGVQLAENGRLPARCNNDGHLIDFQRPQAKNPQPAMKAAPPRGVRAPSHRTPLSDTPYRLPAKRRMPTVNSQPTTAKRASG